MPLVLPMLKASDNSYTDQRHRVQLGDNTYSFRYRWNSLEEAWYCYVGLLGEDPKVKFKIVNGIDLLAPYKAYEEIPKGSLYLEDIEFFWGRPSLAETNQDGRFSLVYFPEDENLTEYFRDYGYTI